MSQLMDTMVYVTVDGYYGLCHSRWILWFMSQSMDTMVYVTVDRYYSLCHS